jgi:hypothetical protein
MTDIFLQYRASQSPGSIYDAIQQQMEKDDETNRLVANEYADFKEFLIDVYMNGGYSEFKECYLQFMRWQEYTDDEIRNEWPELLEEDE